MKQYTETVLGTFIYEGMTIPADPGNRFYKQMLEEVAAGTAEIIAFDHAAQDAADAIQVERQWRNEELATADIEVYKAEDTAGVFDATEWRSYRIELRSWPDSPDFPDSSKRPARPS